MKGKSNNKKPDNFANVALNVRIRNGGLTSRFGFRQIYSGTGDAVQGIVGNQVLLYVHNSELKSVDPDTGVSTTIGTIDSSDDVSFVTYGIYTIIYTGVDYPWVYD